MLFLYGVFHRVLTTQVYYISGDGALELAPKPKTWRSNQLILMKFSLTTAKREPVSKYAPPSDSFIGNKDLAIISQYDSDKSG